MKIIIHSLDELKELAHLVAFGAAPRDSAPTVTATKDALASASNQAKHKQDKHSARLDAFMAAAHYGHDLHPADYEASAEKAVRETSAALREPAATDPATPETVDVPDAVELDANGRPWDEEIDSASKTKTAKGVWTRSRRRDLTDERYNERVAELIAEQRALDADATDEGEAVEPVATETHALPADDEPELPTIEEMEQAAAEHLTALVEGCRELAAGTDGDMRALLDAAKGFIGTYGTFAFDDLKRAVVPDESGNGKALPALKDPERQLLRACIDNYANFT